jgi:cytochrome P450 family 114
MANPVDFLAEMAKPDTLRDPNPFLHWLREHEPVHRSEVGFYLLSRHADVMRVLNQSGTVFRSPERENMASQFPIGVRHRSMAIQLDGFSVRNPPEHTRLRRLVSRAFTARRVEALRVSIERLSDQLLDAIEEPLLAGEVVDLHTALSKPLALLTFCELLGVPLADRNWLSERVECILAAFEYTSEELLFEADEYTDQVEEYFLGLIEARRHPVHDDLLAALVGKHEDEPDELSDAELIASLWVLCLAGFKTTTAGIDRCAQTMFDHPGERVWLRDGRDRAAAFVDEAMRFDGVTVFSGLPRIATRDVEFAGGTIPAGSDVRLLFYAANRDPAVFADPDRFEPGRDTTRALAFGRGIHFCIGTALARSQMAIGLERLHTRFPTLVPAGEPTWDSVRLRALKHFPVTLA